MNKEVRLQYDFIKIEKYLTRTESESLNLGFLGDDISTNEAKHTMHIKHQKSRRQQVDVVLHFNRAENGEISYTYLSLKFSPMYYTQGNNFNYTDNLYKSAFDILSCELNIDLLGFAVVELEFAMIIELPKGKEAFWYISGHKASTDANVEFFEPINDTKTRYKMYGGKKEKGVSFKMYDVAYNFKKKKRFKNNELTNIDGWDNNASYLKLECHYRKTDFEVQDLFLDDVKYYYFCDLCEKYQNWTETSGDVKFNITKRQRNCIPTIVNGYIVYESIHRGYGLWETKRFMTTFMHSHGIFSKSRQQTINSNLSKVQVERVSCYELTSYFEQAKRMYFPEYIN